MKSKQLKTKTQLMDNILDLDGFQAVIIAADDKVIFEYGNIKYDQGYLASCRKSVLAILYGMYPINLDKTLDELKIDDKSPLSAVEKTATIRNLLMARSGIYHPASNEGDDKDKPAEDGDDKPAEDAKDPLPLPLNPDEDADADRSKICGLHLLSNEQYSSDCSCSCSF